MIIEDQETVRKFPKQEKRVETGVIQFGDDWQGLFIRGDDCSQLSLLIKDAIKEDLADKNPIVKVQLDAYLQLLAATRETPA